MNAPTGLVEAGGGYDQTTKPVRSFGRTAVEWPGRASPAAWHGLAGSIVEMLDPHTEADPHAVLVTLLVMFGSALGRGPGFVAEGDFHATNLFAVLVGATSKGRKGTSLGRARQLIAHADPEWAAGRIVSGLSSGEGVTWQVRDPIMKMVAVREKGRPTGEYVEEIDDQGVEDKRLFVVEGEFAQALRVMRREGNTLSPTLRNYWDQGDVAALTKGSPVRATGAHVSIVGHIVRDELRRELTSTDMGNGFANRILWVCSRRSKLLPEGGSPSEDDLRGAGELLAVCLRYGREAGVMRRDDDARELWHHVYGELSTGTPGLVGAVVSRAEAQVMRLAVLYALLDTSKVIRRQHLEAALALWDYSRRSAQFVFGDAVGDQAADQILDALRRSADGLTRTQIRDLFGRNVSGSRIDLALRALEEQRLACCRPESTGGRPAERWFAGSEVRPNDQSANAWAVA